MNEEKGTLPRQWVPKESQGRMNIFISIGGKRRHPSKGARWVKKKYFGTYQGDRWVFYSNYVDEDGQPSRSYIFKASKTPIKRHLKVKAEANPYDPNYRDYFIQREARKRKPGQTELWPS